MISLKKHIVYTLLFCYVCTMAAGLSILVGYSKVSDPTVIGIFTAFVAQTAAIIVAIIKAPEYFAEPEAISKLKKEHIAAISDLQTQLAKSMKDREDMIGFIGTKIMPDDPKHPLYEWIQTQKK
jgi:hypothetical protein